MPSNYNSVSAAPFFKPCCRMITSLLTRHRTPFNSPILPPLQDRPFFFIPAMPAIREWQFFFRSPLLRALSRVKTPFLSPILGPCQIVSTVRERVERCSPPRAVLLFSRTLVFLSFFFFCLAGADRLALNRVSFDRFSPPFPSNHDPIRNKLLSLQERCVPRIFSGSFRGVFLDLPFSFLSARVPLRPIFFSFFDCR